MATNFNLFKELLEKSNQKTAKTGPYWFKPVAGSTHTLRFLPLKSRNFELPLEIYNHHAVNFPDGRFESFACPKKSGESDCPFCDLASLSYKKYTATDDQKFKEAFKQLVVKQNYLLVGYEVDKLDTANIKEEDIKIVRASSKASMEGIVSIMSKEKDFVDFDSGRNCELVKPAGKGAIVATAWQFQDPEPAFTGKKAKEVWDQLLALSPDLTSIITPPTKEKMAELVARFTSQPKVDEPVVSATASAPVKAAKPAVVEDDINDDTLAALRRSMEDAD